MEKSGYFSSEKEMLAFGGQLAAILAPGDVIFLQGHLGVGKTTLARGILQGLGCQSHIKSPTYTMVESYLLGDCSVHHFDLYRIRDPQELYDIGLVDYLSRDAIILIEWPEKAFVLLPLPTLLCEIKILTPTTRSWVLTAKLPRGETLLRLLGCAII